ncbi:hypothetical protein [Clostridium ihumii]|uniref:hypothetical protein n=1 Tax=Clostridium ihumii TaxID=1470356 RepID=UPI00058C1932|nr:hypothetical protein [Clostridium ihumii]
MNGKVNDDGSSTMQKSSKSKTSAGSYVEYNKVIGDYKNESLESMENSSIPKSMRNIIKEYFSIIEE